MIIHTVTSYAFQTHVVRDTDGEIMIGIDGPRGPILVEIHSADESTIERLLTHGDEEDLSDMCSATIHDFYTQIGRCFPGDTFSHFADAPGEIGELVTRPRTAKEIQQARESIAYRDLIEGGLSEQEIQALIV